MSSTTIGQVRIRTDTDDALAARMRGEAALRALDLEPPGMPARTILCIRHLPDPMPGGLDLRSSHAPRATDWERAARNAIRDALRRAVRASDGPVPPTADAVLFDDRAELLACAARDLVRTNGGWWWRNVIRGGLVYVHVVREWLRAPEYVPAALEMLAAGGDAVAFVRTLETQQAVDLTANVLRAHALEPLAGEIVRALAVVPAPAVPRRSTVLPPTLQRLVPEIVTSIAASPNLTVEQRVFATVTLALRRAPAVARGAAFVHEITAWLAPPPAPKPPVPAEVQPPVPRTPPPKDTIAPPPVSPIGPIGPITPGGPVHPMGPTGPMGPMEPIGQTRPTAPPPAAPPWDLDLEPARHEAGVQPPPSPLLESGTVIDSGHAGIFFLLNVAIALGFYDPYGRETPIDLDVWDFLALTGRALVPEIVEDDVWPLLTALANRTEDDALPPLDDELLGRVRESLTLVVEAESPAAFVIRRPARITLSPAHIDVTFCLAAHPIEIRIAGLDRDPGWIPAAGRHVDFHFD